MGTRADFYVGRGRDAEWLGSIAFDGYPDGDGPQAVIFAGKVEDFRADVAKMLAERNDGTTPKDGWPWPWSDSNTTDYAYAFDGDQVWAWGYRWFDPRLPEPDEENYEYEDGPADFPDMTDRKNVALFGPRSGLIVVTPSGVIA